jgi:hypothetical protein
MELRQVDCFVVFLVFFRAFIQIFDDNTFSQSYGSNRLDYDLSVNLEDLLTLFDQRLVGEVNMSLIG